MNDQLEHTFTLVQDAKMFDRFATPHWGGPFFFSACVFVILVLVLWLFGALKKRRAASARPAESPPQSEAVETRAFLIKLGQEFERLRGARVHNAAPETVINQASFGESAPGAAHDRDPDLRAALDRAEADVQAMKALLGEMGVNLDDMRQQRDDALRDRDNWRSQAEQWEAQAERLTLTLPAPCPAAERRTLTLPAPRPAPPATTLEPPSRRSWWPWRRRAG